jgi:hypothetical protein
VRRLYLEEVLGARREQDAERRPAERDVERYSRTMRGK